MIELYQSQVYCLQICGASARVHTSSGVGYKKKTLITGWAGSCPKRKAKVGEKQEPDAFPLRNCLNDWARGGEKSKTVTSSVAKPWLNSWPFHSVENTSPILSSQNVTPRFAMWSISTNILTVLANFLGIQNSIFSKNIGCNRGNTIFEGAGSTYSIY